VGVVRERADHVLVVSEQKSRQGIHSQRASGYLGVEPTTLKLAIIGIALGTGASWIVARLLRSQLFGVTSTDPATLVAMIIDLTALALLSGYLPARRASLIDPTVAFRSG
jgi:hypothetical protein